MELKFKNIVLILIVLVIFISVALVYIFTVETSAEKYTAVLKRYIDTNYQKYQMRNSELSSLLQQELIESSSLIDKGLFVDTENPRKTSYGPEDRWTFFINNSNNQVYGVFYGKKFKIFTIMAKQKHTWDVIQLSVVLMLEKNEPPSQEPQPNNIGK